MHINVGTALYKGIREMTETQATIIIAIVSVTIGALVGAGGTAIIADRLIRGTLNSPALIKAIEALAHGLSPQTIQLLADAGILTTTIATDVKSQQDAQKTPNKPAYVSSEKNLTSLDR